MFLLKEKQKLNGHSEIKQSGSIKIQVRPISAHMKGSGQILLLKAIFVSLAVKKHLHENEQWAAVAGITSHSCHLARQSALRINIQVSMNHVFLLNDRNQCIQARLLDSKLVVVISGKFIS